MIFVSTVLSAACADPVAMQTGGVVGPHYASSKSALHGLVHWLGKNVADKGITVNAVAPALIGDTVMMGSSNDEKTKERAKREYLLHRR